MRFFGRRRGSQNPERGRSHCRSERSANDAVKRVHKLLNAGQNEAAGCSLSNCFGGTPHAELMKSIAWRVSDGRMPGLIKACPQTTLARP